MTRPTPSRRDALRMVPPYRTRATRDTRTDPRFPSKSTFGTCSRRAGPGHGVRGLGGAIEEGTTNRTRCGRGPIVLGDHAPAGAVAFGRARRQSAGRLWAAASSCTAAPSASTTWKRAPVTCDTSSSLGCRRRLSPTLASGWRTGAELASWLAAFLAPASAGLVRSTAEHVCLVGFYGGVPTSTPTSPSRSGVAFRPSCRACRPSSRVWFAFFSSLRSFLRATSSAAFTCCRAWFTFSRACRRCPSSSGGASRRLVRAV